MLTANRVLPVTPLEIVTRVSSAAAAVRIGFDDNRSLGSRETGGRLALPVFQELMLAVYRDKIIGAAPAFPARMEARIAASLLPPTPPPGTYDG